MSRLSYSSQQIYAMWSMDLRPSRSLRKSLFSAQLWVPRTDRSATGYDAANVCVCDQTLSDAGCLHVGVSAAIVIVFVFNFCNIGFIYIFTLSYIVCSVFIWPPCGCLECKISLE